MSRRWRIGHTLFNHVLPDVPDKTLTTARKAATDGGKYNDIVSAAYECFFEKGYDGTSVRSIMTRAGGEIGLFYYYFDSKNDVFDRVLARFFAHYEADFAAIVAHGRRNPCRVMQDFFEYIGCEAGFR